MGRERIMLHLPPGRFERLRISPPVRHSKIQTRRLSVVYTHEVELALNLITMLERRLFALNAFTRNTSRTGHNRWPIALSRPLPLRQPQRRAEYLSLKIPARFTTRRPVLGASKMMTEMNSSTIRRRVFGFPWSVHSPSDLPSTLWMGGEKRKALIRSDLALG